MPKPYFTPEEDARRTKLVLSEPLLGVRELFDRDVVVPANFKKTPAAHAIDAHVEGIKIRNCTIRFKTETWLPAWSLPFNDQPPVGINSYATGLYFPPGASKVDIDGLHVEGSPHFAIWGHSVSDMKLRRFSATRCFGGFYAGEQPLVGAGNCDWDVDQVRVWDTWGPPGGYPSRLRPGGWVGGDGWVSEGDRHLLKRLELSGECYAGAKICRGRDVLVIGMVTPTLMLQGSSSPDPKLPGIHVRVEDLCLNAATGYGELADGGNKVQLSWNVFCQMQGGFIVGNGKDGNAIQATGNVHLDCREMVISGFNGFRGVNNPAHALELDVREPVSTVNPDFEWVNEFPNQERILRRAA